MAIRSRFPSVLCLHQRFRKKCFLLVSLKLKSSSNAGTTNMTIREEQGERPKFGPRPKFDSSNFDFKEELE